MDNPLAANRFDSQIAWLQANAVGYDRLSPEDLLAISTFTMFWTMFECRVTRQDAKLANIFAAVDQWDKAGTLDFAHFSDAFEYVKHRYFHHAEKDMHRYQLNVSTKDQAMFADAFEGRKTHPADKVKALFIVVHRLRNNLFHGVKWNYDIQGQQPNFFHANNVMRAALEYELNPIRSEIL